ncbi:hypothetical protein AB0A63_31260 [Lentzea sp. NPDC042327]|uniref:hypothetical protein n=1 Tax=Lentzea sp. NPDC042327 TaxID=3154801 RepID=UPI0033F3C7FF
MIEEIGDDLERIQKKISLYRDPGAERKRVRRLCWDLARTADFEHDRADQPCSIAISERRAGGYTAACSTHDVDSESLWDTEREARQDFLCDRGRRWSFIIHHRDDHVRPRMLDLTELWDEVRSVVQNGGTVPSTGEVDLIALYRYIDDDVRLPLEIKAIPLLHPVVHLALEHGGTAESPQATDYVTAPGNEQFLVVVHAADEEPDLQLSSVPFSGSDSQVTSAYDRDTATYLRMAFVRQ